MSALRRLSVIGLALLLVCTLVVPVAGEGEANPTLLAQFGGELTVLRVSGSSLYAGIGSSLSIFDVTNPSAPVVQGEVLLPGKVNDLTVAGARVFLALKDKGLWVVDVINPASPVIAGLHSISSGASRVLLQGTTAFVVSGSNLMQIEVADPTNMQVGLSYNAGSASFTTLGGFAGNHLIVGMSDGIRSIDISTMTQASAISSGPVFSVLVNGSSVYAAVNNDGTKVIDASNPAALVAGSGFAPVAQNGLQQTSTHLFVSSFSNINVYSLANPAAPAFVSIFNAPGGSTKSFAVNGNQLFLGNRSNGFDIIDAADVNNLQRLGTQPLPGFAHDAVVNGNTIYALNGGALYVLNTSARSAPTVLGTLKDPNGATFTSIAAKGTLVYLLRGFQGMSVVSVADPSAPTLLGSTNFSGPTPDIAVDGSLVLVADGPNGLRVIDVSNSAAPQQMGSLASIAFSYQVIGFGGYAYVADGNAGLRIVNVSDPASPQETGVYTATGSVTAIAPVNGTQLLIGVENVGVELIDVANPAAPIRLDGANVSGQIASIAVSNGNAFVIGISNGPSGQQRQMISLSVGTSSITPTDSLVIGDGGQIGVSLFHLLLALENSGLQIYANPNAPVLDKSVFLPQIGK